MFFFFFLYVYETESIKSPLSPGAFTFTVAFTTNPRVSIESEIFPHADLSHV